MFDVCITLRSISYNWHMSYIFQLLWRPPSPYQPAPLKFATRFYNLGIYHTFLHNLGRGIVRPPRNSYRCPCRKDEYVTICKHHDSICDNIGLTDFIDCFMVWVWMHQRCFLFYWYILVVYTSQSYRTAIMVTVMFMLSAMRYYRRHICETKDIIYSYTVLGFLLFNLTRIGIYFYIV